MWRADLARLSAGPVASTSHDRQNFHTNPRLTDIPPKVPKVRCQAMRSTLNTVDSQRHTRAAACLTSASESDYLTAEYPDEDPFASRTTANLADFSLAPSGPAARNHYSDTHLRSPANSPSTTPRRLGSSSPSATTSVRRSGRTTPTPQCPHTVSGGSSTDRHRTQPLSSIP